MSYSATVLFFLLGMFVVVDSIKCIYGSDNGKKGHLPKVQHNNTESKFCMNFTVPVNVGTSTMYLSDIFDGCQKDGCMKDKKGREICCCSRDLCNSSYSSLPVLLVTIIPVLVSKVFVA
ncbi:hypothetical protein V3C99_007856 [Haemonchus contortus]